MEKKWQVKPLPIHGHSILDEDGNVIVADVYTLEIAQRIVRDHNSALIRAGTKGVEDD